LTQILNRRVENLRTAKYIDLIFDTFMELRGDRKSGDDRTVLGGLARLCEYKVVVVGYQGSMSEEKSKLPSPEGYRKSLRLMHLAETFKKPVIVIIDIPEVDPLTRDQHQCSNEAIARSLEKMSHLATPIIAVIAGKSNSMLAIDMCAVDSVLMLKDATCSFSSGGANLAGSLCLKAQDLLDLGIVQKIVECPPEDDLESTAVTLREAILEELHQLVKRCPETLGQQRSHKLQFQFLNFKPLEKKSQ